MRHFLRIVLTLLLALSPYQAHAAIGVTVGPVIAYHRGLSASTPDDTVRFSIINRF